jgi:hypothetical protein
MRRTRHIKLALETSIPAEYVGFAVGSRGVSGTGGERQNNEFYQLEGVLLVLHRYRWLARWYIYSAGHLLDSGLTLKAIARWTARRRAEMWADYRRRWPE